MKHKSKYIKMYMQMAELVASYSYCVRKKVGCIVVFPDGLIAEGLNGTAEGDDNKCELDDGTTSPETLHAEMNALGKALTAGYSTLGATLYITLSPCLDCAKMIKIAGISHVIYLNDYKCKKGIEYLRKRCIVVEKYEEVI